MEVKVENSRLLFLVETSEPFVGYWRHLKCKFCYILGFWIVIVNSSPRRIWIIYLQYFFNPKPMIDLWIDIKLE